MADEHSSLQGPCAYTEIKVDLASSRRDIKCLSWEIKSSRWDIKVQQINHRIWAKTAFSERAHRFTNPHPATLVVLSWVKPQRDAFFSY